MIWRISRHGLRAGGAVALVALGLSAGIGPVRAQDDCVVLEDFATAPVGQFPPGWRARKDEGKAVYMVRDEAGIGSSTPPRRASGSRRRRRSPGT